MAVRTEEQHLQYFQLCANRGAWKELSASVSNTTANPARILAFASWHALALRAQGLGAEANQVLVDASRQPFQAAAEEVAEFAEQLVAAAHFEAASILAQRLEDEGVPHAHQVWSVIWREREVWPKAEAALARIAQYPEAHWATSALIQSVWCTLRQGQAQRAMHILSGLTDGTNLSVQKLIARVELALGRFPDAEARLLRVAKALPFDWEWPALLAAAQTPVLIRSQPQVLLEGYTLGLQRQPNQADAHINLARLHHLLGRSQLAQAHLIEALNIKPWLDAPVLMLTEWLLAAGKPQAALSAVDAALARHTSPKRVASRLDVLRITGVGNALNLASQAQNAIAQYPESVPVLRSAGALLQVAKQLDDAAVAYEAARALDPANVGVANNLAILYRERGDHDQAIALWRSVLPRADNAIKLSYAHASLGHGNRVEAESIFTQVLASQPQHPSALRGMVSVRRQADQPRQAMALAQQAINADRKHPHGWVAMAELQAQTGDFAQALQTLQVGIKEVIATLPLRQALFKICIHTQCPQKVLALVTSWVEQEPSEVEHWLMAADAASAASLFDEAERFAKTAFSIEPTVGGAALVRHYLQRDRQTEALQVAEQMVQHQPRVMKHWGLLAEVRYRQGHVEDALSTLSTALLREPTRLALVRQRVGMLLSQERYAEAIAEAKALYDLKPEPLNLALYTQAMTRAQQFAECAFATGLAYAAQPRNLVVALAHASALCRTQRYADAVSVLSTLRISEPENLEVLTSEVKLLGQLGHFDEAVAIMQAFVQRVPDKPDVLLMLGRTMRESGAHDSAKVTIELALRTHSEHLGLRMEHARLLQDVHQDENACTAWRCIAKQFHVSMWFRGGLRSWVYLGLEAELQAELEAWCANEPASPLPLHALIEFAVQLKSYPKQFEWLAKLEQLTDSTIFVLKAKAALYSEIWQMTSAIDFQEKAIALSPAAPGLTLALLNLKAKVGDFDEFEELFDRVNRQWGDARYEQHSNLFFNINCHPTWTATQIGKVYQDWYAHAIKPQVPPFRQWKNKPERQRRLRIGYLSPDFRRHAVAYFSEPLLIEHDRTQFELYAYAEMSEAQSDLYTARFKNYVHHWRNTKHMGDDELERLIRADGIDILVDLAGHTTGNRLRVMLRRPAPVQASWLWGAGQTTGLPEVDYFLSDAWSVPCEHEPHMAERVMRMRQCGLPFKPAHDMPEPSPLPCIKSDEVILGVLARPLRTNRRTMRAWAEILRQAPKARLRFDHVPYAEVDIQQRVTAMFTEQGIGAERLLFCNTRPHWNVYREIDLQLDPFPAGSGTTATEGLLMERLAVSLESRPVMGRIAAAQLRAMGLAEECVALSEDEYIAKAVALANDPLRLINLSNGLRERVQSSWLMDYNGYAQEAGSLYRQMWHKWCQQQPAKCNETTATQ